MAELEKLTEPRRPHNFRIKPSALKRIQDQALKEQRRISIVIERAIDLYCSKAKLDDS